MLCIGAYLNHNLSVTLKGIEGVLHQIFDHPLKECHIYLCLHLAHCQTVVFEGYIARYALTEVHHRFAHNLIERLHRKRCLGANLREAIDNLHKVRQILLHLIYRHLIDGLFAQILYPAEQRRGRCAELVCSLLCQTYPDAVLLVLLYGAEGYKGNQDKDHDDEHLYVGEDVERLQGQRVSVEDYVVVRVCPPEANDDRGVILRHSFEGLAQRCFVVYNLVGYEVVRYDTQIFIGDDEWNVVAVGDDGCHQGVVDIVAHSVTIDPLHSRSPQLHIVLLLLAQGIGHSVCHQQRRTDEEGRYDKDYHTTILQNFISQAS